VAGVVVAVCGVAGLWGCGEGKGGGFVLSYDLPARQPIPESIRAVAVQAEESRNSDARWARVAADKTIAQLQAESAQGRYAVVERSVLQRMLEEQDLQLAFGDPDEAAKNFGKLKTIDAMIFAYVQVSSEARHATRTTVSLASGRPGTGTESYTRYMVTVNMSFKLVDLASGSTRAAHEKRYDYDSDRDGKKSTISTLIGGSSGVPATDAITDALVGQGVGDFVATICPHAVRVETKLAAGKSPTVKSGNALALAGEHEAALEQYKIALDRNADDHGAAYNAGLMYEATGSFDDARKLYARAVALNKDSRYAEGLARVRK